METKANQDDEFLADKVAIVSGAGRGIGRSLALGLARRGVRVVVNNRNRRPEPDGRPVAEVVSSEIVAAGGQAISDLTDASTTEGGSEIVQHALDTWGRLDICIANAGISGAGMAHRQDIEDYLKVIAINLNGAVSLLKASFIHLRAAKAGGRLLVVASTAGLFGDIGLSAYATSKGGLVAFAKTLAAEGSSHSIFTNILMPYASTDMTGTEMESLLGERFSPSALSAIAEALIASKMNGEIVITGGGAVASANVVEYPAQLVDTKDGLSSFELQELLSRSAGGLGRTFDTATDAFSHFVKEQDQR